MKKIIFAISILLALTGCQMATSTKTARGIIPVVGGGATTSRSVTVGAVTETKYENTNPDEIILYEGSKPVISGWEEIPQGVQTGDSFTYAFMNTTVTFTAAVDDNIITYTGEVADTENPDPYKSSLPYHGKIVASINTETGESTYAQNVYYAYYIDKNLSLYISSHSYLTGTYVKGETYYLTGSLYIGRVGYRDDLSTPDVLDATIVDSPEVAAYVVEYKGNTSFEGVLLHCTNFSQLLPLTHGSKVTTHEFLTITPENSLEVRTPTCILLYYIEKNNNPDLIKKMVGVEQSSDEPNIATINQKWSEQ